MLLLASPQLEPQVVSPDLVQQPPLPRVPNPRPLPQPTPLLHSLPQPRLPGVTSNSRTPRMRKASTPSLLHSMPTLLVPVCLLDLFYSLRSISDEYVCYSAGDQACIGTGFAQCVNGKFVVTSCGATLTCAALPLVNKPGTSITCTTAADAAARIQAAGATGGITGS